MRTLTIGIADYDRMKARTLAIARGEHTPARDEPKVWFTSLDSLAKLLSEHNRRLLELIARERPRSDSGSDRSDPDPEACEGRAP